MLPAEFSHYCTETKYLNIPISQYWGAPSHQSSISGKCYNANTLTLHPNFWVLRPRPVFKVFASLILKYHHFSNLINSPKLKLFSSGIQLALMHKNKLRNAVTKWKIFGWKPWRWMKMLPLCFPPSKVQLDLHLSFSNYSPQFQMTTSKVQPK